MSLLAAIQFLLVTPAFVRRRFTPAELGRSLAFFPLVGVLLGGLLAFADAALAHILPIQVRSVAVLILWIVLTGGLHFDGLLDSVDGLLGGNTPERRMEIMRDERTGAYGVAAAGLILLAMFTALNAIPGARWPALLAASALGRCAIVVCVAAFPYARAEGLGRDMKNNARPVHAAAAVLITVAVIAVVVWVSRSWVSARALLVSLAIGWLAVRFIVHRIPGMTGDTYGAINMLIEASVLLTFAAAS